MAALAVATALQGRLPALRLLARRAVIGECGRERPDVDCVHLCTRQPHHSGQHLCPCGHRWDTAI